jgi:hypothetical protein
MNHEMMPESGDSSQAERTANELLEAQVESTKELTSDQLNELCFKIIDVSGGEGNIAEYNKNGLYVEAAYYQALDDDQQPYETTYTVIERRPDHDRNDGAFYRTSAYQIVFGTNTDDGAEFAAKESYYEMYDEKQDAIVRVEEEVEADSLADRLSQVIRASQDRKALGLDRPLNQDDYANLMRLLALTQQ